MQTRIRYQPEEETIDDVSAIDDEERRAFVKNRTLTLPTRTIKELATAVVHRYGIMNYLAAKCAVLREPDTPKTVQNNGGITRRLEDHRRFRVHNTSIGSFDELPPTTYPPQLKPRLIAIHRFTEQLLDPKARPNTTARAMPGWDQDLPIELSLPILPDRKSKRLVMLLTRSSHSATPKNIPLIERHMFQAFFHYRHELKASTFVRLPPEVGTSSRYYTMTIWCSITIHTAPRPKDGPI